MRTSRLFFYAKLKLVLVESVIRLQRSCAILCVNSWNVSACRLLNCLRNENVYAKPGWIYQKNSFLSGVISFSQRQLPPCRLMIGVSLVNCMRSLLPVGSCSHQLGCTVRFILLYLFWFDCVFIVSCPVLSLLLCLFEDGALSALVFLNGLPVRCCHGRRNNFFQGCQRFWNFILLTRN